MTLRLLRGASGAREATGQVVIVDVVRAFTTAAYAFAAGIEEIELVSTVEEALARPGWRMGEVGGRLIPGFDHDNSPSRLAGRRLSGRAVQRTGSGTQGAVLATRAEGLWLGSLAVASATARALKDAAEVSLVAMGAPPEEPGEEDEACAAYLAALIRGEAPSPERTIAVVRARAEAAHRRLGESGFPAADIGCCCALDAFGFAMRVRRPGGRLIAGAVTGAAGFA